MESAYAGVPVILIPFMFDQPRNGRSVERKGWGILRDRFQLIKDPDAIEGAIKEILVNPTLVLNTFLSTSKICALR